MNHQSKAETPSGVIAAFAGCGLMRQANFYPEGNTMTRKQDERIDFERIIVQQGINEAIDRVSDVLRTAHNELIAIKNKLNPGYMFYRQASTDALIELGHRQAEQIVMDILEDCPVDFRRVLNTVLDEEETVENEDDIIDRIRNGTIDKIKGVMDGRTRIGKHNPGQATRTN
jgi:hypothetical protein